MWKLDMLSFLIGHRFEFGQVFSGTSYNGVSLFRKEIPFSNQWKELVRSFPMIGDYLAWKVRSQNKVRLGSNVFLGCRDTKIFMEDSITSLQRDLCTLNQLVKEANTTI